MNAGRHCLVSILAGLGLAGLLAGCSLGGDGDDDGGRTDVTRIPADAETDSRLDDLGIICETELAVSGTFTPNPVQPSPDDFTGCGGIGTWNVVTTVVRKGCEPQPEPLAFNYEATFDVEAASINVAYPADPNNERLNLKITADGGGCIGIFEHFGTDDSVWALQAPLQPDNTLSGEGFYTVYKFDPF